MNIHIIQCDSQVRRDTKITNDDEFEAFMRDGQLEGFGATDFRPVFSYVDKAIESGEFENLKGLIYFTDGYGVFQSTSRRTAMILRLCFLRITMSSRPFRRGRSSWCFRLRI